MDSADSFQLPEKPAKWQVSLHARFDELLGVYSQANSIPLNAAKPRSSLIWLCEAGHSSERTLSSQLNYSRNCVECRSIGLLRPDLAAQLNPAEDMDPFQITLKSNRILSWHCDDCGGDYLRTPEVKLKSPSCPYCSGQAVLPGFNDLKTKRPDLVSLWSAKNSKTIEKVSHRTGDRLHWQCIRSADHQWVARVNELDGRLAKEDDPCPYCSSIAQRATKHGEAIKVIKRLPELTVFWSPKNSQAIESTLWDSGLVVLLECDLGHRYTRRLGKIERSVKEQGSLTCSICSNRLFQEGSNDALTERPELQSILVSPIDLSSVSRGSAIEAEWRCEKGHIYRRSIRDQCFGPNCGVCFKQGRSNLEIEVREFLVANGFEVESNDRSILGGFELDLVLPQLKRAIEINGEWFHSNKRILKRPSTSAAKFESIEGYHLHKRELALLRGYDLAFVWEFDWNRERDIVKAELMDWINGAEKSDRLLRISSLLDT